MPEKWKSIIGIELQELLRLRRISQGQLAEYLGVKAASVTYLMQGRIRLSLERLEQILTFLRADAATIEHFEKLWFEQTQTADVRTPGNFARMVCRCRAGLTGAELSTQTGIPESRLKELENVPAVEPSVDEIEKLKKVYNCEAGILWGTVPVVETAEKKENFLQVHESPAALLRRVEVPVLECEAMKCYREGCDFREFLKDNCSREEVVEYHEGEIIPVAKVLFPSTRLGWDMKGSMALLLGMPNSELPHGLYLGRSTYGIYRLWKRRRRSWIPFFLDFYEKKSRPAWCIPVSGFCFYAEP